MLINNEISGEIKKYLEGNYLVETEKGVPDLLVFLLNANGEKNKEWICFVMLKIGSIKEETKIKLLDLYFLMRRRGFNYSDNLLQEKFTKDLEDGKKLEKGLEKEWNNFTSKKEEAYQFGVRKERDIKFNLTFSKFDTKKNEEGKEWKTLSKVSAAHNFYLLREIISSLVINFGEEGKFSKVSSGEEAMLKVEFDI